MNLRTTTSPGEAIVIVYQGPLGAMYVGAFGLVLSVYLVASGKLFPVVFAHALWDVIPFLMPSA